MESHNNSAQRAVDEVFCDFRDTYMSDTIRFYEPPVLEELEKEMTEKRDFERIELKIYFQR